MAEARIVTPTHHNYHPPPRPVPSQPSPEAGFGKHLEMPVKHHEAGAGEAASVGRNLVVLWVLCWLAASPGF